MPIPVVFQKGTGNQIQASLNINNNYNTLYQGLTNIAAIWNFTLDVAASTTDSSNGANNSFWGEYRANWTFNGSGTVDGPNAWAWAGTGAYTNGDASWASIASPFEENYSGQIGNQAGYSVDFAPPS